MSRHADDALSHPEEREVTVLSAGLRGFDELFAQLAPDTLVETMLNRYFDAMSAIVTRHGGTLDKYTGNGLRAVFGWPIAKADDAAQAVASAVEMQVMFGRLCLQWQQTLNVTVTLGIGIGLGKVVAGSIGSPKHQDYTVLGQGVSIALALEQQAHGGEILMSHALVGRLPSSLEGVEFEEFPPVPVRGMPGEHEIVLVRFEPSPGATQLLPATT